MLQLLMIEKNVCKKFDRGKFPRKMHYLAKYTCLNWFRSVFSLPRILCIVYIFSYPIIRTMRE